MIKEAIMAKPIVNKITPFDAATDKVISFSWNGDRSYSNRLTIFDADTMVQMYNEKISTSLHSHTLPAGTLTNGRKWIAQFRVFDMEDIETGLSDQIYFRTFKTPLFYFYGPEDGQTLRTASYEAQVYYFQEDYEDIQSYRFYLYDGTKTLLNESDTMYDGSKIKYIYRGLDNHTVYYLKCHGITSGGMEIDTGYIKIYTDYKMPSTYGILYAENDPLHGYIKYHTNIRIIQYNGNKTFTFKDGMIDLRDDSIHYEEGFTIDDDFTLKLRGMYLNQTAEILELRNTRYSLILSSFLQEDGTTRFKITVPNGLGNYILYSEPLAFDAEDIVCIWLRRVNDIYRLEAIPHDLAEENNLWYGQQMPAGPDEHDSWIDAPNLFTYAVDRNTVKTYLSEKEPEDENMKTDDIWI